MVADPRRQGCVFVSVRGEDEGFASGRIKRRKTDCKRTTRRPSDGCERRVLLGRFCCFSVGSAVGTEIYTARRSRYRIRHCGGGQKGGKVIRRNLRKLIHLLSGQAVRMGPLLISKSKKQNGHPLRTPRDRNVRKNDTEKKDRLSLQSGKRRCDITPHSLERCGVRSHRRSTTV